MNLYENKTEFNRVNCKEELDNLDERSNSAKDKEIVIKKECTNVLLDIDNNTDYHNNFSLKIKNEEFHIKDDSNFDIQETEGKCKEEKDIDPEAKNILIKKEYTEDLPDINSEFPNNFSVKIEMDELHIKNEESNVNILASYHLVHTSDKCYNCDICEKSFTRTHSLKQHHLTHTRQKKYQCDICEKNFTQLSHLRYHHSVHTGVKIKKRYKCNICKKSFTDISTLRKHHLIHTGEKKYKCNICDKSFTQNSTLKQHYLTHLNEKNYKCNICEKSFTDLSTLRKHLLVHTGERNYKCDVCEKSFSRSFHLKRHYLIHSGKKL